MAKKQANLDKEAVDMDNGITKVEEYRDKGKKDYEALGGKEPEEGWAAAGIASAAATVIRMAEEDRIAAEYNAALEVKNAERKAAQKAARLAAAAAAKA